MAVERSSEFEKPLNSKPSLAGLQQTDLLVCGPCCPGEILHGQPIKLTDVPDSIVHTQGEMAKESSRYQMISLVLLISVDHDIDKGGKAVTVASSKRLVLRGSS